MTLAKCAGCGAELIAPEDGQPYWCTECSQAADEKEREAREPRSTRKNTIIKPENSHPDISLEGFSGFLKGEQGEWVRVDKVLLVVPIEAHSDAGDSDYQEGYSEYSLGITVAEGSPLHIVWRMGTDKHSRIMINLWQEDLMKAIMTLAHDPASTAAKRRVETVLKSIDDDTRERESYESNPLLRDVPPSNTG